MIGQNNDLFNGWIIVVYVSIVLTGVSLIVIVLGGLPSPGLGLKSYPFFNYVIRNSEKSWYLET